jgi:UrcA family protein
MNANFPALNTKSCICIAAVAACITLAVPVQAKEHIVGVKLSVTTTDLDLKQPADALKLYRRLQKAADIVCGHGNRVDLRPVPDFAACHEQALGDAVRSANRPQLTIVYLRSHTLQDAATRGIEVPALVAAK